MIELYVWTLIIAVNLFAISSIISKYLIVKAGGPVNFLLYQLIIASPFLLIISYFEYWKDNDLIELINFRLFIIFFLISFFAFIGYISLLTGFNEGNVSVGGIILSARVLFSVPLAIIILSETYGMIVYISIGLALIGSILVSWESKMNLHALFSLSAPGIRWYFLTTISWSLSNFFIRYLENEIPTFTIIVIRQGYMIAFMAILFLLRNDQLVNQRKPLNLSLGLKLLAYSIIIICAQGGFVYGLSQSLTIAEGIGVTEGTFTFIYAVLIARYIDNSVLDEPLDQKSLSIRTLGVLIAVLGTLGVVIFSLR